MIGSKTVVYTSGTFDMIHYNHLKMIEYARSLGDILIVGVNTDELVASYKSEPIIPFEERIALMKAIKGPDIIIPQHSLDHRDKVKKLKFDVFVIGDDWTGKFDYLEELGVSVVYFPYGQGVSSSSLKEKIYKNYKKLQDKANSHFPLNFDSKSARAGRPV
ncbi:MAG: adenylyltransferase/cytidyltransferase family protein [Candidatus Omnitrophica bacterium]|nr:adenylyltransferase/cytidyltransferase family protein [Candidatus Omnitrophota bacterium]